jgi:hypothetical protein
VLKSSQMFGLILKLKKTAQNKQLPDEKAFAQSGHPAH